MNRDEDFQDAVRVELARKVVRLKRRVAELERGGEGAGEDELCLDFLETIRTETKSWRYEDAAQVLARVDRLVKAALDGLRTGREGRDDG